MAQDINIDSQLDTEWNEVGDLKLVTDLEEIKQSIVISVIEYAGLAIESLSDTAIEEKRGDIEEVVEANDRTQPPIIVDVESIDYDEGAVNYIVKTNRVTLPLSIE